MRLLAYAMGGTWLGMVLVAVGLIAVAGSWTGTAPGCGPGRSDSPRPPEGPPLPRAVAAARRVGLSGTQARDAAVIVRTGRSMGIPPKGQIDAVATAEQESNLENLPYGPQDSLGLFQQRPSAGWGSAAQIMDPVHAATAFYTRLIQVPGWTAMPVTVAAQAVQHSAAPRAYARWKAVATRVVHALDTRARGGARAVLASARRGAGRGSIGASRCPGGGTGPGPGVGGGSPRQPRGAGARASPGRGP